jgi:outer membrane receptor for ferrienterochelin and colicin
MKYIIPYLCLSILLCVSSVVAGTTGKLAGRVTDRQSTEAVVGANVIIKGTSLGASMDIDGYYFIINIPPGNYEVTVSCIGYTRMTYRASIQVDHTTTLDIPLSAESVRLEEIIVEAERVSIQRDQSSTVQRVNADELAMLPVNSISAVLQLQTGVVNTGALHVRGGRAGEVGYYLDGYRVEDPLFNGSVLEVNNQAIQEMELLSGTFNAEYGNALSGVVNIVTKDNEGRIRANLSYKRTNLGIEKAGNDLNERYIEGTISGPLWSNSPVGLLISGKKVDADNYYSSGLTETTGGTKQSIDFSRDKPFGFNDLFTMVGKLSLTPFGSAKITLLDNYSKRKWKSYSHSMRYIPDSTYVSSSESNLLGLNFRHAVTKNLFYDVRLSYYQYDYLRSVNGWSPSQYTRAMFTTFSNSLFYQNMSSSAYENQTTKAYTLKGDVTWQLNRLNLVKMGIELKANDLDYYYNSNPVNPTDQVVNIYRKKPVEGSGYIQDKIEFETIVLNLGIRYDLFDAATSYPGDPFNPNDPLKEPLKTETQSTLSPRVGIAYPVRDNMVFHFTYGQFFQKPEYQTLYNNLEREFANRGTTLFGSPTLKPQKTSSYELGISAAFGAGASAQVTFFSKKIENLIGVAWIYLPHAYAYYVNEDFATVKGFEISTKVKLRDVSFAVNYTYSVAKGSSSTQQERYTSVYNIVGVQSLRFLPLDFDQRHTGNAQIAIDFGKDEGPFGYLTPVFENTSCNLVAQYGSGLTYTFNPARSIYVAEPNNSRLPERITLDLLARKAFTFGPVELGIFVDVRNLLNRKNIVSVYSATGSPVYSGDESNKATPDYQQDPTNFSTPRTIYFGVDIGL